MPEKTLIAGIRPEEDSPFLVVASPVVGVADRAPQPGIFLNPLDRILSLRVLNERLVLRLPRDVSGRVVEVLVGRGLTPVAYNDALLRLDPRALSETGPAEAVAAGPRAGGLSSSPGRGADDDAPTGVITVTAPSEGMFYRRSSPDAPPFVEVGSKITSGTILGLVEVMKCFNPIHYGGPGFPERGAITRVFVEESREVEFGQPLFWVVPEE